jgi:predicted nuclease of predicted toxin-antitoxin system
MSQNRKPKFLVDENISPLTVEFLRELGFDVIDLVELDNKGITNGELVKLANSKNRIIITLDLDFGEIHYFSSKKKFGVIVIRLKTPTIENINTVIGKFFEEIDFQKVDLSKSLIILDEKKYRIRK